MRYIISILVILTALVGCASRYPLGMSEVEWNTLTPEQQLEARNHQAALDEAARERREAAAQLRAEQERERAEQERKEQQAYLQAIRDAQPGELLQCTLSNAEGYFSNQWQTLEPIGFNLLVGYQHNAVLTNANRSSQSVRMNLLYTGANIQICTDNRRECTNFVATQNQLRNGVTQFISLANTARGEMYCDIPNLQPRRGW